MKTTKKVGEFIVHEDGSYTLHAGINRDTAEVNGNQFSCGRRGNRALKHIIAYAKQNGFRKVTVNLDCKARKAACNRRFLEKLGAHSDWSYNDYTGYNLDL